MHKLPVHRNDRSLVKNTLAVGLWIVTLLAACQDDVTIGPTTPVYTVSGTVSGLASGATLVLKNNGGDALTLYSNGTFTFPSETGPGSSYGVTASADPSQTCTVNGGSGTVTTNVTSVKVTCADNPPAVTAVGTPSGTATTASIGPNGGSLSSSDSRLAVSIPPGALASTTVISIQPIINNAPGGVGFAYRLTPDGQTFAMPVQLIWHYSQSDVERSAPQALAVSYQDAGGHWVEYANGTLNTADTTFAITTDHFTDNALGVRWFLVADTSQVGLNQTDTLTFVQCSVSQSTGFLEQCFTASGSDFEFVNATVNGVTGGDSSDGFVSPPLPDDPIAISYKAPAAVPVSNPVSVELTLQLHGSLGLIESAGTPIKIVQCLPAAQGIPPYCTYSGTFKNANGIPASSGTVIWELQTDPAIVAQFLGGPSALGTYIYTVRTGSVNLTDIRRGCSLVPAALPLTLSNTIAPITGLPAFLQLSLVAGQEQYFGFGTIDTSHEIERCVTPLGTFDTPYSFPSEPWVSIPPPFPLSPDAKTLAGTAGRYSWTFTAGD